MLFAVKFIQIKTHKNANRNRTKEKIDRSETGFRTEIVLGIGLIR